MNDPVEIDWGPDGITVTDVLAERHISQADLRQRVYAAIHPSITAKKLAHESHVSAATIRAFANGERTPHEDVLERIEEAMNRLEGGEA